MRLKAKDTMHVSSVGAENLRRDEEFDVSDSEGKELIARGLATKVGGAAKKAAAPANKMKAAPTNKAITSAKRKR